MSPQYRRSTFRMQDINNLGDDNVATVGADGAADAILVNVPRAEDSNTKDNNSNRCPEFLFSRHLLLHRADFRWRRQHVALSFQTQQNGIPIGTCVTHVDSTWRIGTRPRRARRRGAKKTTRRGSLGRTRNSTSPQGTNLARRLCTRMCFPRSLDG